MSDFGSSGANTCHIPSIILNNMKKKGSQNLIFFPLELNSWCCPTCHLKRKVFGRKITQEHKYQPAHLYPTILEYPSHWVDIWFQHSMFLHRSCIWKDQFRRKNERHSKLQLECFICLFQPSSITPNYNYCIRSRWDAGVPFAEELRREEIMSKTT